MLVAIDDPFRWCIFCAADNHSDDEHGPLCPENTGLFPVSDRLIADGFACMGCARPFASGEFYCLHEAEAEGLYETVCVGCKAQAELLAA